MKPTLLLLLLLLLLRLLLSLWAPLVASSARPVPPDPCDPEIQRDRRTLRPDQLTVLINGYAESRIPLLRSIAATYASSPSVAAVLVLWGNPSTPAPTLSLLARNLSAAAPISLLRHPTATLNARFLPRPAIATRAVAVCDDDVELDPSTLDFAFRVWTANPDRLIGLFPRSHDLDLSARRWIYTVHPDRYSILLTKFMIFRTDYLHRYSCGGGLAMAEMRAIVDRVRNCEDILMNFVITDETGAAPVLVGADRARDWGDWRNEPRRGSEEEEEGGDGVREVGLSSRRGEHRKRRGECIGEFHRVLGRMPLRYGYGKVVNSVGEQGLCEKGGRLVFCDQQVEE